MPLSADGLLRFLFGQGWWSVGLVLTSLVGYGVPYFWAARVGQTGIKRDVSLFVLILAGPLLAFVYLGLKLAGASFPLGNPTIVIVVSLFSGIQMLSLGVIGEYVGRIYDESRNRPKYILESRYGWEDEPGA